MKQPRRTAIVGLGNLLLQDDGVGVHAVRRLLADPPPAVDVYDFGTAILHALSVLQDHQQVVAIDAMLGGGRPGSLFLVEGRSTAGPGACASIHALGLCAALRFMPAGNGAPEVIVLGVQPDSIACHIGLSAPVEAALPRVVARAREIAAFWHRHPLPAASLLGALAEGGLCDASAGRRDVSGLTQGATVSKPQTRDDS